MKEDFVQVDNLLLAYKEKNPQAARTIFFIHGNSCSSRMWGKQLESELLQQYRLIAIDLPGHGKSSASDNADKDYSPVGTARILSQVVKKLSADNPYIMVGFSYGTNLIAEMIPYGIKPSGIVFIGPCVLGENYGMEKAFIQRDKPSIFFYNETDEKNISLFLHEHIIFPGANDIQILTEDYLSVSAEFKPALFKTAAEGKISDEISLLQQLDVPTCIIFGQKDQLVNINYLDSFPFPVWENTIYKLQGAGHWANIDNAETVNQLIFDYSIERFIAGRVS